MEHYGPIMGFWIAAFMITPILRKVFWTVRSRTLATILMFSYRMKFSISNVQLRRVILWRKIASRRHKTSKTYLLCKKAEAYVIDIDDHISRVIDPLDIYRELLTGLLIGSDERNYENAHDH